MNKTLKILGWGVVAVFGAVAVGTVALHRGEPINALWLVAAATCCYALAYRFYSKFIAAKILVLDGSRATPAERLENGRDFLVTNKWVVFGHHFAAIAGPGPLVGPVLAAQFGYLPGTMWVLAGAVFAGCVQDFVILLFSVRRDGKSLTEMAKSEIGRVGGFVAYAAVISILIILLAVAALIVVNALKASPWGTFTIAMTMPIALLMGVYLRRARAGDSDHGLWFCRVGVAGVAAAGATRLPEHIRKVGNDCSAGSWHRSAASHVAYAGADSVCRWHGAGVCREDISVRLHHDCVRSDQRISRADLQWHNSEAHRAGDRDTHGGLRGDDVRVGRRGDGDYCGVRDAAGGVFRHQQSGGNCGASTGDCGGDHFELGLSGDSRGYASVGACRGRADALQPDGRRAGVCRGDGAHLLA